MNKAKKLKLNKITISELDKKSLAKIIGASQGGCQNETTPNDTNPLCAISEGC